MKKNIVVILTVVMLLLIAGSVYALVIDSNKDINVTDTSGDHSENKDTSAPATSDKQTNGTAQPESTTQINEAAVVTIKDFAFSPGNLTVKRGTTVTWTNEDDARHNATSNQDGGPKGSLLSKGQSYTFTFEKVGTFNYFCTPHPNMTGTVTVTE